MVFKRLVTKLKRPSPAIDRPGPTQTNNDGRVSRPVGPQNPTPDPPPATGERNLWLEAVGKLPRKSQMELEKRGMSTSHPEPLTDQVEAFRKEAEALRDRSMERDWKIRFGENEIPIRQTTVHIVRWASKIGDVAIQFSPSPGAGVWAVAKSILQEIDTFDKEKSALLTVVDKVAGALFSGQVYYEIYTPERIGREDVVDKLYDALVDLYACVLELLATSTDLSSNTAIQFCHAVFGTKKPSVALSELQSAEQHVAAAASRCESITQARHEADFKKFLQDADDSLNNISRNMEQVLELVSEQERRSLLEWISTVPYGRHHEEIEERRKPDTGDWLIAHAKFCEWLDSPSSSILWLQGSPGTGKTFLTSAVVKHIEQTIVEQTEGFAYFFCNRDEQERREALPVLRSLVRQLAAPKCNAQCVRKSLQEARGMATDRGVSQLGLSQCLGQLLDSFDLYSTTFVILDALDEVLNEELDILMERLDDAVGKTTAGNRVKIFAASRPEKEIARMYGSASTIVIHAGDNGADIEKYVKGELDAIARKYPESDVNIMRDLIRMTILNKCDNMFLWAALQIKQITQCDSIDAIEYALKTLPRGLNATYDQIFAKIEDRLRPERELADRTIKWVLGAPSPLSSDVLLGAVRISIEGDQVGLSRPVTKEALLSICENLLIVDSDEKWRFFHLSAREYLEDTRKVSRDAHCHCAQVTFQSLMISFSPSRPSGPSKPDKLHRSGAPQDPFDPTHSFSRHIQTHWSVYARQLAEEAEPIALLKQFLGSVRESSPFFVRWADYTFSRNVLVEFHRAIGSLLPEDRLYPTTTPVFAIAHFSLYNLLRDWFDDWTYDPTQMNRRGEPLLEIAARTGCVPFCAQLVSRGASFGSESAFSGSPYGSALAAAAARGHVELLRYIFDEFQVDVNRQLKTGIHGSVLAAAAKWSRLDVVRYLVEDAQAKVELLLENGDFGSALTAAAHGGNLDIVRYLVDEARADVNLRPEAGDFGSALAAAAWQGYLPVIRYLVAEARADVNQLLPAGRYGSALTAAAKGGNLDSLRYLVKEAKADVNLLLDSGEYGSALAGAATDTKLTFVRCLVEEGKADVDLQLRAGHFGSALAAAAQGEPNILRYLVEEAGANVNLPLKIGQFGSALAAAAVRGLETVRYLVETAQPDVNLILEVGAYGSALAAAATRENVSVVRYLVEKAHADVNLQLRAGLYGSALAAAAYCGSFTIVRYLIERGNADVNLPLYGGRYRSALAAAAAGGQLEIVRYLVENGEAEVNFPPSEAGKHISVLAHAIEGENMDIIKYLVEECEADVNLRFQYEHYSSALEVALSMEDQSIAHHLISRGAVED